MFKPPRQYTNEFINYINSVPENKKEIKDITEPIILENNNNFKIFEYQKCDGVSHWKEHVTLNRLDNTETVKVDERREVCTCV